jgi:hypothetical protein
MNFTKLEMMNASHGKLDYLIYLVENGSEWDYKNILMKH